MWRFSDYERVPRETAWLMTLRAAVLALIDRKLQLLAELEAIDADLREAHRTLGEIPSLAHPPAAPPPPARPRARLVRKPCHRCGQAFEMRPTTKFCKPCFSAQASERMKATQAARRAVLTADARRL